MKLLWNELGFVRQRLRVGSSESANLSSDSPKVLMSAEQTAAEMCGSQ